MIRNGLFKHFLEESDDIFIVVDEALVVRYVTAAVQSLFGVGSLSMLGVQLSNFLPQEKIVNWITQVEKADSLPVQDEVTLEGRDQKIRHFEVAVSASRNPEGNFFFLKLHDITSRKERECFLAKSNAQLDQIIYKTTHDLKAPLSSALGLVHLAQLAPADDQQKYLSMIRGSLLKLEAFINEMTNFFRNEKMEVKREPVDLEKLLQEELDDLGTQIKSKGIEIRTDIRQTSALYSDVLRLRTVIGNLLSNAVKYYDPERPQKFIDITISVSELNCQVVIADNGIGIDKVFQDRIFDLFFRATTQAEGTGMGLFIVKDTIEKLRGTIELESELGKGSRFVIGIPNQVLQPVRAA